MITLSTGEIYIHWKAQLVFPQDSDLSVKLLYVEFEHPILGLDPWIGLCNQTDLFVCLFFVHWKSLTFDFRRPELSYRSRARVRFIPLLRQKCASQNNFREGCCSHIGFGVEPDHRCGKWFKSYHWYQLIEVIEGLPFCSCRASLATDVYQSRGPQFRVRQGFNPSKLSREPNDIRSKLGPLSIVSNQTNVIYRAVDTMKVPQTRSPTNLRHLPDQIELELEMLLLRPV